MYSVILIALAGLGVGYLLRRRPFLRHVDTSLSLTVSLMLFVLGWAVGSNRQIVDNLLHLGGEAALIGGLATLGSALAAWLLFRLSFKSKGTPHER